MSSKEVTQENNQPLDQQQVPVSVVDECPLPKALVALINNSNRELQLAQQRLLNDVNESAQEIMEMMSLKREDGWLIDIEGLRFVRIEQSVE